MSNSPPVGYDPHDDDASDALHVAHDISFHHHFYFHRTLDEDNEQERSTDIDMESLFEPKNGTPVAGVPDEESEQDLEEDDAGDIHIAIHFDLLGVGVTPADTPPPFPSSSVPVTPLSPMQAFLMAATGNRGKSGTPLSLYSPSPAEAQYARYAAVRVGVPQLAGRPPENRALPLMLSFEQRLVPASGSLEQPFSWGQIPSGSLHEEVDTPMVLLDVAGATQLISLMRSWIQEQSDQEGTSASPL